MKQVVGCIIGSIYFIIAILLALSFATVTPCEGGLLKNTITGDVAPEVYTSGRFFTDIIHKFVLYPTTLQYVRFGGDSEYSELALKVSDATGQEVTISCAFQYRLMVTKLYDVFKLYGATGYQTQVVTSAGATIKNTVKQYGLVQFLSAREVIAEVIHAALNEVLQKEVFAVVEHFQLLQIDPPVATAANILNKIVTQETVKTQRTMKQSQVLSTNITLKGKEAEQYERVYTSTAKRESENIRSAAEAEAIGIRLNATAQAYQALKTNLSLSNDELVQLLFLDHIRTLSGSSSMAIGVDTALISA